MELTIRHEMPDEYRTVENLVRDAFWGCMDHPTCDGEHYLVHVLRTLPSYVPELDFVALCGDEIVGHIIYSRSKVVTDKGEEIEVLNFGPISVLPQYKKKGVGSALMRHSIEEAKKLGYRAIIFFGHPDYYPRFGFRRASEFGITAFDGGSYDALMAMELYPGALDGISGRYYEDEVYSVVEEEWEEFDKSFEPKEPAELMSIDALVSKLPEEIGRIFIEQEIEYVPQLLRSSGAEMLAWQGMDRDKLAQVNEVLAQLGAPPKIIPQ